MTRGEVWGADLGVPFGSEPGFRCPALIVQADSFNRSRIRSVLCAPFTTNLRLGDAPDNVFVAAEVSGLSMDSVLVVSQTSCLDQRRLVERAGRLASDDLADVEAGLRLVLAL